jgi:membrane-bound lytic murein transglycosylase A
VRGALVKKEQSLFTAYYSPDFEASYTKTKEYKHPIYKKPVDSNDYNYTRVDIDFDGAFEGKNLDIAYVKESLYDIWLLHVEGGGRLKLKDSQGNTYYKYLSYDGRNNHSFRFLYHYMIDSGMLQRGAASVDEQRYYLEQNPQDQREVFSYCPSYIFFKLSDQEPLGVQNIIMTPMRTMATDYRRIKHYGLLYYVEAQKPISNTQYRNFSRFFINQDTGGAIRGNARADLYFGYGHDAELAANKLKTYGNQYILIHK